jgi:hypothetical protein
VDDNRVATADEIQHLFKLGTFSVFARCVIDKSAVKFQAFQLSDGLLARVLTLM